MKKFIDFHVNDSYYLFLYALSEDYLVSTAKERFYRPQFLQYFDLSERTLGRYFKQYKDLGLVERKKPGHLLLKEEVTLPKELVPDMCRPRYYATYCCLQEIWASPDKTLSATRICKMMGYGEETLKSSAKLSFINDILEFFKEKGWISWTGRMGHRALTECHFGH